MDNKFNNKTRQVLIKELFNEYYGRLVYFSCQMVGDKAIAEDIVQDVFIKYWDQNDISALNDAETKSFFYTSVKNASLNIIRHNKVAQKYIMQQDKNPIEESVMISIIRSEVVAEIYKVIESLPSACRQISQMGYIEGKKNHEIADELGLSVNTVKTQKQRALKILRLKLT